MNVKFIQIICGSTLSAKEMRRVGGRMNLLSWLKINLLKVLWFGLSWVGKEFYGFISVSKLSMLIITKIKFYCHSFKIAKKLKSWILVIGDDGLLTFNKIWHLLTRWKLLLNFSKNMKLGVSNGAQKRQTYQS